MRVLADTFSGLWRPFALAAALYAGLGILTADSTSGSNGADGFSCRGLTNSGAFNRNLCRLHPARIGNLAVSDIAWWR